MKQMRSSLQNLSISYEFALAIGNSLNLSEMLHEVIHKMVHKTNAHHGIIWVNNGEKKLQPVASAGINIKDVPAQGEKIDFRNIFNQILQTEQYVLRCKDDKDFLRYCPVLTEKEESVLIVPVTNVAIIYLVYSSIEIADKPLANLLTGLSKKLSLAIEACMAHKNIINEVHVRVEAEEELKKKTEQLISGEKELQRLYGESEQARKSLFSILEDVARKEEALGESEKKYRDLFEKSEDASLVIHNGRFTDCNQAAINMLRYDNKNGILEMHPSELSPKKQTDGKSSLIKANEMMKIAFKNGSHRFEWIHKRSNGEVFPVEVLLTAISTNEKNQIFHTVLRDITERKKAEEIIQESEKKYRLLADNSMDAIWQMDKKLVFTYISPSVENILGYTVDEWVGTRLSQHASTKDFFSIARKALYATKNYKKFKFLTFETNMLKKDGTEVPVEIIGRLLLDKKGFPIGLQGTTHDITERRKADKELKKHRQHLEETVKQRTREIENKSKKLEESQNVLTFLLEDVNEARNELESTNLQLQTANKEMESFTFSVSHDLRAPLRSILGFSNKFAEIYGEKVDEEGRRLLNVINSNTKKMGMLIDDLLAFSRMGRSDMRKVKVDIKGLAHETWNEQKDQYADRKIELTIKDMSVVKGDRNMLRQVLFNLLSNAAKFSKYKEVSRIEVGANTDDSEIVYYVKDNGAGFDMRYKNKLFQVFQRLHSDREFEGTGVGLAIVKKVIDMHGGKVWAESEPDKKTTIYFSLPE